MVSIGCEDGSGTSSPGLDSIASRHWQIGSGTWFVQTFRVRRLAPPAIALRIADAHLASLEMAREQVVVPRHGRQLFTGLWYPDSQRFSPVVIR
jgi:hypothetical protein